MIIIIIVTIIIMFITMLIISSISLDFHGRIESETQAGATRRMKQEACRLMMMMLTMRMCRLMMMVLMMRIEDVEVNAEDGDDEDDKLDLQGKHDHLFHQ